MMRNTVARMLLCWWRWFFWNQVRNEERWNVTRGMRDDGFVSYMFRLRDYSMWHPLGD